MSQELHYTSVPRGLKPGSRGFCTVACTPQMPGPLVERLENLSSYQPVYPYHDPAASRNPINFAHIRLTIGGRSVSVLSRLGPAGLDYSGRANKYAHHVVLEANERPEGGPAWLLSQPGFMQAAWEGEPRVLPEGRRPPQGDRPAGIARAWQTLTGDAGWAGALAESFLADPRRPVFLIFQPGMELLPLLVEAIALVPPPRRWDVEFSTYLTKLPQGVSCPWRGVLEGSPEAENARHLPNALIMDLCRPAGQAQGGTLIHLARTGERREEPGMGMVAPPPSGPIRPAIPVAGRPIPAAEAPPRAMPPGPPVSYELIPELAARMAKQGSAFQGGGPTRPRRKRTWPLVAGLVAACLIPLVAMGFLLRVEVKSLLTSGPEVGRLLANPASKVEGNRIPEEDRTKERRDEKERKGKEGKKQDGHKEPPTAPPLEDQSKLPTRPPPPDGLPSGSPEPREPQKGPPRKATTPEGAPAIITDPVFLVLPDSKSQVSSINEAKSPPLGGPQQRITNLKLLGGGVELKTEPGKSKGEAMNLIVFATAKDNQPGDPHPAKTELATFEVSKEGVLTFHGSTDPDPTARQRLRDCVLMIEQESGGQRYVILRGKPQIKSKPPNKNGLPLQDPKPTGGTTTYEVTWDADEYFKDAVGILGIAECLLLNKNGQCVVTLTKQRDGSWVDPRSAVSIKIDGSKLLVDLKLDLQNENQARLDDRIRRRRKRKSDHERELRKTEQHKDDEIRRKIEVLTQELERLEYFKLIHDSLINVVITWEIEGRRFEIARSERIPRTEGPQPPQTPKAP